MIDNSNHEVYVFTMQGMSLNYTRCVVLAYFGNINHFDMNSIHSCKYLSVIINYVLLTWDDHNETVKNLILYYFVCDNGKNSVLVRIKYA